MYTRAMLDPTRITKRAAGASTKLANAAMHASSMSFVTAYQTVSGSAHGLSTTIPNSCSPYFLEASEYFVCYQYNERLHVIDDNPFHASELVPARIVADRAFIGRAVNRRWIRLQWVNSQAPAGSTQRYAFHYSRHGGFTVCPRGYGR